MKVVWNNINNPNPAAAIFVLWEQLWDAVVFRVVLVAANSRSNFAQATSRAQLVFLPPRIRPDIQCGLPRFAWEEFDEELERVPGIDADYDAHCQAARELAVDYFSTDCVLPLLD